MAAPTLISYVETASWFTNDGTGSKTSPAITWQTNDVIVVLAAAEGPDTLGLPTATGLTFVSQKSNTTVGTCGTQIAAAVAAGNGSTTVNVTTNDISHHYGFGVWVWRGSAGIGNSAEQHTTTKSVPMTPTAADCGVCWGTFDFSASTVTTIIPAPTTERQRVDGGADYAIYVSDLGDQVSAGAVEYGLNVAPAGPVSIVVLEIKAGTATVRSYGNLLLMGVG